MARVHLALGANLGDRQTALAEATRRIHALPQTAVLARSSVYETSALCQLGEGGVHPPYLNAVVLVETGASPHALLTALKGVEASMGRTAGKRWGPRIIDIDVILWEKRVVNEKDLSIPHPHMHLRRFVLAPLAELSPAAVHPLLEKTAAELLSALP